MTKEPTVKNILVSFNSINLEALEQQRLTLKAIDQTSITVDEAEAIGTAIELISTIINNNQGLPFYITKQRNYGLDKFYPVQGDTIGEALGFLLNRKAFTKEDLRHLVSLGFNPQLLPEILDLTDNEADIKARENIKTKPHRRRNKGVPNND